MRKWLKNPQQAEQRLFSWPLLVIAAVIIWSILVWKLPVHLSFDILDVSAPGVNQSHAIDDASGREESGDDVWSTEASRVQPASAQDIASQASDRKPSTLLAQLVAPPGLQTSEGEQGLEKPEISEDLQAIVRQSVPDGVTIERIENRQHQLVVYGHAADNAQVARYLRAIQNRGAHPELRSLKVESLDGNTTSAFSVLVE